MNLVAPYCECPQCSYWGLHLMAEVQEQGFPRTLMVIEPDDTLSRKLVYVKAAWVIRECLDCGHKFHQHWKEWNDW